MNRYLWHYSYNNWYYVKHPHVFIRDTYLMIKWFFQRGYRGYADCDVWSIDGYLLSWLPEALTVLTKNQHGYPANMSGPEEWEDILNAMISGLKSANKSLMLEGETPEDNRRLYEAGEVGLDLFRKHFYSLWD